MKPVKLREEVYELIQKLAEKEQTSMATIIEKAIALYTGGTSDTAPLKSYREFEIVNYYTRKCSKCGRELKEGERIILIKYEYEGAPPKNIYLCADCYLSLDPRLGKIFRKKKELELTIRQLRKEAEELSKQVSIMELAVAVKNLLDLYLKSKGTSEEGRRTVEVLEKLEEVTEKLRLLESSVKVRVKAGRPQYEYHRATYRRG
jgi:pyruvate-formate lyase